MTRRGFREARHDLPSRLKLVLPSFGAGCVGAFADDAVSVRPDVVAAGFLATSFAALLAAFGYIWRRGHGV